MKTPATGAILEAETPRGSGFFWQSSLALSNPFKDHGVPLHVVRRYKKVKKQPLANGSAMTFSFQDS